MTDKPVLHRRRLVSTVIVHDQVHIQIIRHLLIDSFQKLQEFLAAMTTMQTANDFTGGNIQRGKQRRRAVAQIVMRASFGNPRGQRQNRLGAIQRLYLALFINAKHQRLHRRVQVQTHDVPRLLDKQRIGRQLEGLLSMRRKPGEGDIMDAKLRFIDDRPFPGYDQLWLMIQQVWDVF